jgi:hypothetical protein
VVQTFKVAPAAMMQKAKQVEQLNKEIHDELNHIQTCFTTLALGWAGETKQEATEVINRWNAVSIELFGTGGDEKEDVAKMTPSQLGVLFFILRGMAGATEIYAGVEAGIEEYYMEFRKMLTSLSGHDGTSSTPPGDISNTHETAVGESWSRSS